MISTDPVDVVREALAALNREDWIGAATLCDPVSLAAFKRNLLEQLAPTAPRHAFTVESLLRGEPEMPRAVAEYQVARFQERATLEHRLRDDLPTVPDLQALEQMSPQAAFAAWLEGKSPREQIARLLAAGRIKPAVASRSLSNPMQAYRYALLGTVMDGDRIAHVIYRHDFDEQTQWQGEWAHWIDKLPADQQQLARETLGRSHPQAATCRRQPDGSWGLIADHEFIGVGGMIIASIEEGE